MTAITNRHIDLSNYEQKDLKINVSNGAALTIQCEGLGSAVSLKGKNIMAEESTLLHGISGAFETVDEISEDGLYTFDVAGIDIVELETEGNEGSVSIKVVD